MINWTNEIVHDIATRRCVLYLGSGVSANSININGKRPATWDAFLRGIINKPKCSGIKDEVEQLLRKEDFLTACEIIVEAIGEHDFGEEAANEYRRPGYNHHAIHELIFSLDSKIVITPNIDKIYEQYALTASNSTIVIKTYSDDDVAKYLRSPDYLIIKAHGTVDKTDEIIFTHQQYASARYKYSAFYKILDSLVLTHTFIFIGCGIADPDIQLILENYNFNFPKCRCHFFISAADHYSEQIKRSLKRNRNIEVITYENTSGDHAELFKSLEELKDIVDVERQSIAGTASW